MKQFILSNDAVAMIEAIRTNKHEIKGRLCDAFCDLIFMIENVEDFSSVFPAMKILQEYSHLVDALSGVLESEDDKCPIDLQIK